LILLGFSDNLYLVFVLFLIAAIVEAITMPTEMTYATQIVPRMYWARMQSLRVTGFQIPAGFASLAAGFLIVDYGYWATFALAGSMRLLSALILLGIFGAHRADRPEDGAGWS
jgi:MFS family permease